jgi:hypothetical protein
MKKRKERREEDEKTRRREDEKKRRRGKRKVEGQQGRRVHAAVADRPHNHVHAPGMSSSALHSSPAIGTSYKRTRTSELKMNRPAVGAKSPEGSPPPKI